MIFYCFKQNRLAIWKVECLNLSPALLLPGHNVYTVVSVFTYQVHIFYNLEEYMYSDF